MLGYRPHFQLFQLFPRMGLGGLLCLAVTFAALRAAEPVDWNKLELVEEIDATQPRAKDGRFKEYPEGISRVGHVLDGAARVLPNDQPGMKYFGYLIGADRGLKAGETYVLEIEYPEDKPRSVIVANRGNETSRGFHTGSTVGDALHPPYVNNAPESLDVPLSGRFEKARMLMRLQDRFSEINYPRGAPVPDPAEAKRTMQPKDGFWVYIAQFAPEQDPLNAGAAVSKIRLYRAPRDAFALATRPPPGDLPQRRLFFREEMADGVIGGKPEENGFDDAMDWYGGKFELMRFLGMNTFSKDLLEFGANQGWDSSRYGGNEWVYQSKTPKLWEKCVEAAAKHGLDLLPYYEYAGSKGAKGLGFEKRAVPLKGENYTHIKWTETARADLTDPDTFEDFRRMLELTVTDLQTRARFAGIWLRPRSSQLPISFADATLERFRQATGREEEVTRGQLQQDKKLYAAYLAWWNGQRREFLLKIQNYLAESGLEDAVVLYTADPSEPGHIQPGGAQSGLVAEDPKAWKNADLKRPPAPLERAVAERWAYRAQTSPRGTWGQWEWQHAVPPPNPEAYRETRGILPTLAINRRYTVDDAAALEVFSTPSGLALIRHYSLNEDAIREKKNKDDKGLDRLGYFVADMERAGPFCMLAEARAMAHGNPTHFGYLSANSFNRFFPDPVRDFNAAFLALPALPAEVVPGAASEAAVVVKRLDGGEHGTWLAVVNPTYESKEGVAITLPVRGRVTNAATGEPVEASGGKVTLSLRPCQLVSLRIR